MWNRIGTNATGAALAIVLLAGPAHAQTQFTESAPGTFDLTKNPGCGVGGLSKEEKAKRNERIAEYYFQNYVDTAKSNAMHHGWDEWDCWGDGATMLIGIWTPPPSKPQVFPIPRGDAAKKLVQEGKSGAQLEMVMWKKVYPNWGGVQGSFRVIQAEENSVTWAMLFAGDDPKTKEHMSTWEVDSIHVSDEGKIMHYECWNDTLNLNVGFPRVSGKRLQDLNMGAYGTAIDGKTTQPK